MGAGCCRDVNLKWYFSKLRVSLRGVGNDKPREYEYEYAEDRIGIGMIENRKGLESRGVLGKGLGMGGES